MTRWKKTSDGDLLGELELPIAVGIVGGVTNVHPMVMLALKLLGVESSANLAKVFSAVGLAQNLSGYPCLSNCWDSEGTHEAPCKEYSYFCWCSRKSNRYRSKQNDPRGESKCIKSKGNCSIHDRSNLV